MNIDTVAFESFRQEVLLGFKHLDSKIQILDTKVNTLDKKVDTLGKKVVALDHRIGTLEKTVGDFQERSSRIVGDLGEYIATITYNQKLFDKHLINLAVQFERFSN